MNGFVKWLVSPILIGLAGLVAYTWIMLNWSYGSGERAGYVQKFSNRGYVCKTWEGELAMVSMVLWVIFEFDASIMSNNLVTHPTEPHLDAFFPT